jgi:hypothetical protein
MVVTEFFGYLGLSLERFCAPSRQRPQQGERFCPAFDPDGKGGRETSRRWHEFN